MKRSSRGGKRVLTLQKALRVHGSSRIAFTGAGGKTSAIFRLARELRARNRSVLVTSTTHFSGQQVGLGDHHIVLSDEPRLEDALPEGIVVFTSGAAADGRVAGVSPGAAAALGAFAARSGIPLLIEADGSRQLPAKAPAAHEPVVPDFVDCVVVTAGLGVLGRPLDSEHVHRPELFSRLSGLPLGEKVTGEALQAVLAHPEGGLKGIPGPARRIALLNQADTPLLQSRGSRIADALLAQYDSVVLAALTVTEGAILARERVAGIVLAAGSSRRMGEVKQLLPWRGKPLVVHAVEKALETGCNPVVVVTGGESERVAAAVRHLPVTVAHNPEWEAGQSTSVRAGLEVLPANSGGALFLLVDQPYVETPLLRALLDAHARSLSPIVAPLIDGQRGNPVLFDRETFADFDTIRGDRGGRVLFSKHRAEWVPWHDARALLDIDTPADYESLKRG